MKVLSEKELKAEIANMSVFVGDEPAHIGGTPVFLGDLPQLDGAKTQKKFGPLAAAYNLDCVWTQEMRWRHCLPRTCMVVKVEKAKDPKLPDCEIVTVLDRKGESAGSSLRLPYLTLFNMAVDCIKDMKEAIPEGSLEEKKSLLVAVDRLIEEGVRLNDDRMKSYFKGLGYDPMQAATSLPENTAMVFSKEIEQSTYRVRSLSDILHYSLACCPSARATLHRCECGMHGAPCGKIFIARRKDAKYCYFKRAKIGEGDVKSCREIMNARGAYETEEDKKKKRADKPTKNELRRKIHVRLSKRSDQAAKQDFVANWNALEKKYESEFYRYEEQYRFLQEQDEANRLRPKRS